MVFSLSSLSIRAFIAAAYIANAVAQECGGGCFNQLVMPFYPQNADCFNAMIPVDVSFDKVEFNATRWTNDFQLVDFLAVATTRDLGAKNPNPLGGTSKVNTTFQIAASFCTPKQATEKAKTVILATHGIGPGRSHWNSAFQPEKFNFVQFAVDKGYSVFFYDRVGCGASQKISGFDAQINTGIAVLQSLAKLVRGGTVTPNIGKPNKVALMGFSLGSLMTHGAISLTPEIADAVILTAIGFNKTGLNVNGLTRSFVPRIAALQNPALYGDRDAGYVTWGDIFAQAMNYFKEPNFDPTAVEFAEIAKEPFAIMEFLTILSGPLNVDKFTAPALLISGEIDYIFCDGLCDGIFEQPAKTIYKNAKLQLELVPGTSHNINFHNNATGAYGVITDFLGTNGL